MILGSRLHTSYSDFMLMPIYMRNYLVNRLIGSATEN